jgi:hypothetical protein
VKRREKCKSSRRLVNGNAVLISELFSVSEGDAIEVNTDLIEQHKLSIVAKVESAKPKKAPSAKEQVKQSETQKRQAGWRKLYREQLKKHPIKSKTWHSEQIAKKIIDKGEKPISAKHIFKYMTC